MSWINSIECFFFSYLTICINAESPMAHPGFEPTTSLMKVCQCSEIIWFQMTYNDGDGTIGITMRTRTWQLPYPRLVQPRRLSSHCKTISAWIERLTNEILTQDTGGIVKLSSAAGLAVVVDVADVKGSVAEVVPEPQNRGRVEKENQEQKFKTRRTFSRHHFFSWCCSSLWKYLLFVFLCLF